MASSDALHAAINALSVKIDTLIAARQKDQDMILAQNTTIKTQTVTIGSLNDTVSSLNTTNVQLQSTVTAMNDEKKTNDAAMASLTAELTALADKIPAIPPVG